MHILVFAKRPHMGIIARMDPGQNHPQNVGTCPGLPLQLLTRNLFFQNERPEPPPPPLNKITIFKITKNKNFRAHVPSLVIRALASAPQHKKKIVRAALGPKGREQLNKPADPARFFFFFLHSAASTI